jgi:hypothetical protein
MGKSTTSSEAENDMREIESELQRIKDIWQEVQTYAVPGLDDEKAECGRKVDLVCQTLTAATKHRATTAEPPSQKEIALAVLDVMDFVVGAYTFYGKLKSIRPFGPKELEVGNSLKALLQHCQEIFASFRDPSKPIPAENEPPIKLNDWAGAIAPQEKAG